MRNLSADIWLRKLEINYNDGKKTEVMVTSKKDIEIKSRIKVEEICLKQVASLKYLGTIITSEGRCNTEIRSG
jgi:hypothetical protein